MGQGIFPNFHTLQLAQTVNIGGASAHDILQVQSGASALMVGRPVTVPGAKTAYVMSVDESTQKITLSGQLQPSASNTTAVAGSSFTIGSGEKLWAALNRGAHTPPERMQLTVAANVAKGDNEIQVRWPYPVINEALLELATIETVNGVGLPSDASIASFTTVSGTIATKDLVLQLTLAGTDVAIAAIAEDELVQVEQVDNTQVGYGLKGVAAPIISANSDWGGAVKIFELQSVAAAMFREGDDPSSAIPETPANGIPATTKQANRWPPQAGLGGSPKKPRGSASKIFACGALCHRADLAKQPRFFARLPKITSAPQANAPQASKIGRAARFWGFLGTARPKSHCSARALATS